MNGRAEGRRVETIALAHQIEVMARTKRLKPLAKYLRRPDRSKTDNSAVIDMFEELAAKGGPVRIRRVTRVPESE